MRGPSTEPIGLQLIAAGRAVSLAFDDTLQAAGSSLSVWLAMVSLQGRSHGAHGELVEVGGADGAMSVEQMEADGLIRRTVDPDNQERHLIELTEAGQGLFHGLLRAVVAFDTRLRAGFSDQEIALLGDTLQRLRRNVEGSDAA